MLTRTEKSTHVDPCSLSYGVVTLPDESQGDDIVGVNCDKPVAVFAVWVRVGVVGRKDESRRPCHIPTTRSLRDKKGGRDG